MRSPRVQRFVLVLASALLLGTLGAAGMPTAHWVPSIGAAALLLSLSVAFFVRFEELTPLSRSLGASFLGLILALGNPRLPLKIAMGFLSLSFVVGSIGALSPKAISGNNAGQNATPGRTTGARNRIWKVGFIALASIAAVLFEAPLVSASSLFLLFVWERIRWEQDLFLRVRTSGHLYFAALLLLLVTGSLSFGQEAAPATLAVASLILWSSHETMARFTDMEIERTLPAAVVALLLSLLVGLIAALRVPAWAGGALFLVFAFLSFLSLSLWGTARGTWLRTLERAELALFSREEGLGVPRRALHALREGLREGLNQSPVLYFRGESWTVDAAGYAESKSAELPKELAIVARDEPFAILLRSVVQSKEVRDARYRAVSEWMKALELE
ncbi:MAG: hypothetical protein KBF88_08275, partial [Polyangiaceae bacterium]|nr:hypothetical protein [Polyangiaceae bacterium]